MAGQLTGVLGQKLNGASQVMDAGTGSRDLATIRAIYHEARHINLEAKAKQDEDKLRKDARGPPQRVGSKKFADAARTVCQGSKRMVKAKSVIEAIQQSAAKQEAAALQHAASMKSKVDDLEHALRQGRSFEDMRDSLRDAVGALGHNDTATAQRLHDMLQSILTATHVLSGGFKQMATNLKEVQGLLAAVSATLAAAQSSMPGLEQMSSWVEDYNRRNPERQEQPEMDAEHEGATEQDVPCKAVGDSNCQPSDSCERNAATDDFEVVERMDALCQPISSSPHLQSEETGSPLQLGSDAGAITPFAGSTIQEPPAESVSKHQESQVQNPPEAARSAACEEVEVSACSHAGLKVAWTPVTYPEDVHPTKLQQKITFDSDLTDEGGEVLKHMSDLGPDSPVAEMPLADEDGASSVTVSRKVVKENLSRLSCWRKVKTKDEFEAERRQQELEEELQADSVALERAHRLHTIRSLRLPQSLRGREVEGDSLVKLTEVREVASKRKDFRRAKTTSQLPQQAPCLDSDDEPYEDSPIALAIPPRSKTERLPPVAPDTPRHAGEACPAGRFASKEKPAIAAAVDMSTFLGEMQQGVALQELFRRPPRVEARKFSHPLPGVVGRTLCPEPTPRAQRAAKVAVAALRITT